MKSSCILFFILICCNINLNAQDYFQQEVNYTISVRLNDIEHSLSGVESVQYINNSPDELKYLYFHIWPNAYKNNSTAFARQQVENGNTQFFYADKDERGYIDSLEFAVNNKKVKWLPDDYNIDICRLILNQSLLPGDTITISTPFYVKIPSSFSRLGHEGQAYQISQWYPKPAVYDRNGWNQMPYLDQGEFYSEFGSFDVTITLPRNYVVGATGNLVSPDEIEWLNKKSADTTGVVNFPASEKEFKTIRYKEKNIHDFAWFADKRYKVRKGEVVLDNNKKVTTWAMFTEKQSHIWNNAIEYINDAVSYYSDWYGNYPYDNCSAVYGGLQSGGAMEYPTITVVGEAISPLMLESFIMHEVGHNWFYGILGFNERRYPYLDEGINSFSEFRYLQKKYPDLKLYKMLINNGSLARLVNLEDVPYGFYYDILHLMPARINADQPLNLSSDVYTEMNYGMVVYYKACLAYTYLLQYLGEDKFDHIMEEFFREWQFKHPGPDDLRHAFEKNCNEDLSWFFDEIMTTTEKIDYAIKRIKGDRLLIKNSGRIASPVLLTALKEDERLLAKWYPGFEGKKWLDFPLQSADKVVLFDAVWLPEMNRKNNQLRTHGPLKGMEPLNVRPLQILEKPGIMQAGIFPALGWNYYNNLMLGLLLYNPLIPQQTLEYQLMPMVGLGNRDIAGMGKVSLNFYPDASFLQSFQFSIDARRFGYARSDGSSYNRTRAEALFTLKNASARSPLKKTLKVGYTTVDESGVSFIGDIFESYFITMDANLQNRNVLNPYQINLNVEVHNNYTRSSAEIKYSHSLKYASNALQIRLFAAGFLQKGADYDNYYALRLSGASGYNDYKYEHLFLGRYEHIADENRQALLSQQFVMDEGGFISNNPFAFSDRWLATAGLLLRIPKLPVSVFVNAGSYSGAGDIFWTAPSDKVIASSEIAFESGAMINLGNVIKIYFPFFTSRDISAINEEFTDNYWQIIRYSIDFNALNLFKLKNRMF